MSNSLFSTTAAQPRTLLTENEVAAIIGMSVHWLRRMRWQGGGIPFVRMNPLSKRGAIRYHLRDVEAFKASLPLRHSTSEQVHQ